MGYLFLSMALLAGCTKGFCGKKVSGLVGGFKDAMLTNFIRMGFCIIIGMLAVALSSGLSAFKINFPMLCVSALSGITTAGFVIFWLISVKNGAYVMLDVFLMLGVIVATVMCRIFLSEAITINQYIGFVILMIAAYIMCSYNVSLKGRFTVKSFALLLLCGVSNGLTGFSQKLFVYYVPSGSSAVFNFYTYIFAAIVLLISYLVCISKDKNSFSHDFTLAKSVIGTIFVMSVCLFANSYFMVLAARMLSSAVLFPLSQGSSLILASLMAAFFFGEKPNAKSIAGMVIAFGALIILNM